MDARSKQQGGFDSGPPSTLTKDHRRLNFAIVNTLDNNDHQAFVTTTTTSMMTRRCGGRPDPQRPCSKPAHTAMPADKIFHPAVTMTVHIQYAIDPSATRAVLNEKLIRYFPDSNLLLEATNTKVKSIKICVLVDQACTPFRTVTTSLRKTQFVKNSRIST